MKSLASEPGRLIGAGNEDVGLTEIGLCLHAFLHISLPLLPDYDVKMPNFTFRGGRKQATTEFSFSF